MMLTRRDFLRMLGVSPSAFFAFRTDPPIELHNNMAWYGNGEDVGVLDLSGISEGVFHNLKMGGLILGRTEQGHGAGNSFYNCIFDGMVYSVAAEGCRFVNCTFITRDGSPVYINASSDMLEYGLRGGSNTLGWFTGCAFRNYSGAENVPLIQLLGTTSGLVFRDSYAYVGDAGIAFQVNGSSQGITIHDFRIEGENDCLLIENVPGSSFLFNWDVARINYSPFSGFMVRSSHHLLNCNFDFNRNGNAKKYFHMLAGYIWRCRIAGNKADWAEGGQLRMNHLTWTNGEPVIYGPDDNIVSYTD